MNAIKRTTETLKLKAEHPRRFTGIAGELPLTKSKAHRLLRARKQTELIKYASGEGTDSLVEIQNPFLSRKHGGIGSSPNPSFLDKHYGRLISSDLYNHPSQLSGVRGAGVFQHWKGPD